METAPTEQSETQNPPYKDVPIVRIDNGTENLRIIELPMDKWDDAAPLAIDEFELVNFCTTKPKDWVKKNVRGQCMEALAAAVEEVNAPFFAHLARRSARIQRLMPGAMESAVRMHRRS